VSSLTTLLAFLVAIGLLVTIHELGHYFVARLANVKILRFSVGFGRPLLVRRVGADQTEWVIAAIPLGGFVRMLDEREANVAAAELHRAFNRQSAWKRIAIVLAGPCANFLLAGVIYWALFVTGTPGIRPYVAAPAAGSVAAAAGFKEMDLIRKIDDQEVVTWQDVRWILLKKSFARGAVNVVVENDKAQTSQLSLSLDGLDKDDLDRDFLAKLGLQRYRPAIAPVVGEVLPQRAAERAGLLPGDRITYAAGKEIRQWEDLVAAIGAAPGRAIDLVIRRAGREQVVSVTPGAETDAAGKTVGRIGITPLVDENEAQRWLLNVRYDIFTAVGKAAAKVWDMSFFSLKMLGKMISGDISWKNLSGPITIADYAGQSAQQGLIVYLGFLALVSVSIGVLNLLPIPILDGGQLVYYVVEILKGSPVSERVVEVGQQIGLALLLGLTAFAFYNDIHRLITG
jgi:regulator of sigma E protease